MIFLCFRVFLVFSLCFCLFNSLATVNLSSALYCFVICACNLWEMNYLLNHVLTYLLTLFRKDESLYSDVVSVFCHYFLKQNKLLLVEIFLSGRRRFFFCDLSSSCPVTNTNGPEPCLSLHMRHSDWVVCDRNIPAATMMPILSC